MAKKVLIVEDEPTLSGAMKAKLEKEGYVVAIAKNGLEGLQMVSTEKPDIVLLDIVMPVMDGISLLRNLRRDPQAGGVPVIVLSNLSDSEDILKVMEDEAYDYLIKSDVTLETIVAKIKARLGE